MTALHIDWTACDGRGLCAELVPEVIVRDEWGFPVGVDGRREPYVPAAAAKRARRAVKACPRLALSLTDRDGRTDGGDRGAPAGH